VYEHTEGITEKNNQM